MVTGARHNTIWAIHRWSPKYHQSSRAHRLPRDIVDISGPGSWAPSPPVPRQLDSLYCGHYRLFGQRYCKRHRRPFPPVGCSTVRSIRELEGHRGSVITDSNTELVLGLSQHLSDPSPFPHKNSDTTPSACLSLLDVVHDSLFRSLASGWSVTYAEVIDLYVIDTALSWRHSLIYKNKPLLSISLCFLLSPSPQPLGSSQAGASLRCSSLTAPL